MRNFFYLALANFFFFLGNSLFHLFSIYLGEMGASRSYIGIIMGLTTATLVCVTWILRNRVDFMDKKKYLILAALLSMGIYTGYYLRADYTTIPFLRFAQGLIYSVGFSFGSALLVEIIPQEKRASLIGIFGISGALTNALGPYIGEKIVKALGFPWLFLTAAFLSVFWLAALFQIRVSKAGVAPEQENPASTREYLRVIPLALIFGSAFSSFFSFISHYASELRLIPVSAFYLSYTAVLISIRLISSDRINRWNRGKVIPGSFLLAFASLTLAFLLHFYPSLVLLGVVGGCYGMAHGFLYPSLNILFIDQTPRRGGKATLMFILFFNLGNTLASFLYGILADFSGYASMYLFSSAVIFLGSVYFFKDFFYGCWTFGRRIFRIFG